MLRITKITILKKLLVSILLLIISTSIYSKTCNQLIFEILNKTKIEIDARAVDIPVNKIKKHLLPEIERVKELALEAGLIFPNKPIRVTIHPNFNFPGSIASIKLRSDMLDITVPYQHLYESKPHRKSKTWKTYSRHPIYSLPSFHHELGHAVLKHNILRKKTKAANFFYLEAYTQELAIEGKKLLEKTSNLPETEMEEIMIPFMKNFEEVSTKYDNMSDQNMGRYLKGLDELFADTVALLINKKANAMDLSTIRRPINKANNYSYTSRNFSNPNNEISVWQGPDDDIHNFFSPCRYHLYDNYLKLPIYIAGIKRNKILANLLLAIEEFSEIPPEELNKMNLYQANQELIKILDLLMKETS